MKATDDKLATVIAEVQRAQGEERATPLAIARLSYLIERTSLERFGRPLAEKAFVNTPIGPMGASLYESISKGEWAHLREGAKPNFNKAELRIVDEVTAELGSLDENGLGDYISNNCREWDWSVKSGEPLPIESIYRALSIPEVEIAGLVRGRQEREGLDATWKRLKEGNSEFGL